MRLYQLYKHYGKMSTIQEAKRAAAYKAVDEYVKNGFKIGIGSGSTIVFAIDRLAEKVGNEKLDVICVPTSFQSHQLLVRKQLPIGELEVHPQLDLCIDGADEVDANLNLIKGGGGCLLQEKIIASCAKKFIVVADYTKNSRSLGDQYKKGIPIEVLPLAYIPVKYKIESKYGGNLELRMAVAKAGPVVTDNGNFILDWKNFKQNVDWNVINGDILQIPGVIETGLFIGMAEKAYFGLEDGTIKEQNKQ